MLKLSCIPLALCVALLAATMPAPSSAEEIPERLKQEATALFQSVMKHENVVRGRCSLDSNWSDAPVPFWVAHQHLGLRVHADLVPMEHGTEPAEVIDPAGQMKEAFCNDDEARKWENAQGEEFKRGEKKTQDGVQARSLSINRIEFSFPVFDQSYRRAVILVTSVVTGWYRRSDGTVGGYPAELAVIADVYIKRDGVWRFGNSEVLGQT